MKRAFLTNLGVTDSDTIKQIIDFHQSVVQDLKDDLSAVRTDLKTAQTDLKTANKAVEDLKNQEPNTDDVEVYKQKLEDLQGKYDTDIAAKQKEYDDFKTATETQKEVDTKKSLLRSQLTADGANSKLVDLLELKFDIDAIELDGDKIKDWETVSKSVKEQYADVFGTTQTQGAKVATPPANNQSSYTIEDVRKMSAQDINKNWDKIKNTLQKG